MGLMRTNQVPGEEELDWGQALLQSGTPEQSKPQQSEPLKCPRCGSMNTKFCYYNNYNKSQPRHFCKSCKRHWTKGGTLRNVPVGGGRKNKRPKVSTSAAPKIPTTSDALCPKFRLRRNTSGDQILDASNVNLYQTMIRPFTPSFHETTDGIINNIVDTKNFSGRSTIDLADLINGSAPPDRNPSTEFQISGLSTGFDVTASLMTKSYEPLDTYDCSYAANFDSIEESTITTVNMDPSSSGSGSAAWGGLDTSSPLELPSYWNWSEIDALTSAKVNVAWDESAGEDDEDGAKIKP